MPSHVSPQHYCQSFCLELHLFAQSLDLFVLCSKQPLIHRHPALQVQNASICFWAYQSCQLINKNRTTGKTNNHKIYITINQVLVGVDRSRSQLTSLVCSLCLELTEFGLQLLSAPLLHVVTKLRQTKMPGKQARGSLRHMHRKLKAWERHLARPSRRHPVVTSGDRWTRLFKLCCRREGRCGVMNLPPGCLQLADTAALC